MEPSISLCMIVRDEAENLRRCLAAAEKIADELIVVDTGSADATREVAVSHGARLLEYPWDGDFAAARNASIAQATGEWILWLDADEVPECGDPAALRDCLRHAPGDMAAVSMLHYYGEEPADPLRSHKSCAFRLLRRSAGPRFKGKIHEQPVQGQGSPAPSMEPLPHLRIFHYGYMEQERARKNSRNLGLLLENRAQDPKDGWQDYHLAAEYYRAGDAKGALRAVNTAILDFLGRGFLPPAIVYKLKYDILVSTDRYEAAWPGAEKAVALYPDYVDLHYYKGRVLLGLGEYTQAERSFARCLILGENNSKYLILTGTGSFLALYYLGLCGELRREYEQAAEAYRQALAIYPGFEDARQGLLRLEKEPLTLAGGHETHEK